MKKIFLFLFLLPAAIPLAARDFDAITPSGHTIYCDVVQGGAKVVGWDYSRTAEPTHLTLPSYVRNGDVSLRLVAIGDSCFRFYNNLLSVEIPSTVKTLGRAAFYWCYGLGSISVPASVDSIGPDAFGLIPNVEYTGTAQGAPWGAYNLNAYHEGQYYYSDNQKTRIVCCSRDATDATIPPTVSSIGTFAFAFCVNITSVKIDSTVNNMEWGAFDNCTNLENIFYNPKWRTSNATEGGVFQNCVNVREVTFGTSVTEILPSICEYCSSLTDIYFPGPNIITKIGNRAFSNCSSLRKIILPDFKGEGRIDDLAFDLCPDISQIVCMNDTVPRLSGTGFGIGPVTGDLDPETVTVYVPCGKEDDYRQSNGWRKFSNIEGMPYYVVATANNRRWGWVDVIQPTCGDNIAIMEATPEEGYRFVRWDDGNTDNPRWLNHTGSGYVYRKAIFESTSGIQALEASPDIKVYTSYGNIVIEGAAGEQASLFDVMGRRLLTAKVYESPFSIMRSQIPNTGIYLVKIGNRKTKKILIAK